MTYLTVIQALTLCHVWYSLYKIYNVIIGNCDLDDTKPGPHALSCLAQWWEEAGCSIYGTLSPLHADLTYWHSQNVGAVKADMALYHQYTFDGSRSGDGLFTYMQYCLGETATAGISYITLNRSQPSSNKGLDVILLNMFFAFQALFVRQIGDLLLVDAIVYIPHLKTLANLELSVRVLEEI